MRTLKRLFSPARWHNLRRTTPISNIFGLDRGTPVDRYYIEKFLLRNAASIQGTILEIGDNTYTKKFGSGSYTSEVLHFSEGYPGATRVGDLTKIETLPRGEMDCFICTQTLNFIYDFKKAIEGINYVLKPGGTALVTLAGLSQVSRYDMDRWGDFWRFNTLSAGQAFNEFFKPEGVEVNSYGNVLTSVAGLHGISAEELTSKELDFQDPDYQIVITVKARKV